MQELEKELEQYKDFDFNIYTDKEKENLEVLKKIKGYAFVKKLQSQLKSHTPKRKLNVTSLKNKLGVDLSEQLERKRELS